MLLELSNIVTFVIGFIAFEWAILPLITFAARFGV